METSTKYQVMNGSSLNKPLKVLNLYAGLGGNRKLWEDVEVTAVENDPETARFYQDQFKDDTVIVGDAHQYLLDHFKEFDFIWSSPPCQTHTRLNRTNYALGVKPKYPVMTLYEEILLLQSFSYDKFKYVVENVIPYYPALIEGKELDRHLFWSNFTIQNYNIIDKKLTHDLAKKEGYLENFFGFDLAGYIFKNKGQRLRNCVHPETGLHILNCARGVIHQENVNQEVMNFEKK